MSYHLHTKRGYSFPAVSSAMQKAIRRGDAKLAGYLLAALPTALSFAIILLAALVPIYRESAESWIARDELTRTVVNGINAYEVEIARQKRRETNAILGFE